MLGHSGNRVDVYRDYVVKHTRSAYVEASYLHELGVGPTIHAIGTDMYVMERLQELDPGLGRWALLEALNTLKRQVWTRPPVSHNSLWRQHLAGWARKLGHTYASTMISLLSAVYPADTVVEEPCLIHGDPTLANCLTRTGCEVVLIDPIEPEGKVPSFRSVDIGKLLQSAFGWETALGGWPLLDESAEELVLRGLKGREKTRAFFWLGVHCLRVLPYSKRTDITEWAEKTAKEAFDIARNS